MSVGGLVGAADASARSLWERRHVGIVGALPIGAVTSARHDVSRHLTSSGKRWLMVEEVGIKLRASNRLEESALEMSKEVAEFGDAALLRKKLSPQSDERRSHILCFLKNTTWKGALQFRTSQSINSQLRHELLLPWSSLLLETDNKQN